MTLKAYFGIKFYEDHSNKDEVDALVKVLKSDGIEPLCNYPDKRWPKAQWYNAGDR